MSGRKINFKQADATAKWRNKFDTNNFIIVQFLI